MADEEADKLFLTDNNYGMDWKYTCGYCGKSYSVNDDHACMQGIVKRVEKIEEYFNKMERERDGFDRWWKERYGSFATDFNKAIEEVSKK